MGLYNRFCKRFFSAKIIRLTAQSDSRAPVARVHNYFKIEVLKKTVSKNEN